jgi:hypothetical protein
MMIDERSDQDIILSIARKVMCEVSEKLVAANQKKFLLKGGQQVIYEVDRNRKYLNSLMQDSSSNQLTEDERIALSAYIAHETGYGNCGENAQLAYVFLRREQKSRYEVAFTSLKEGDHAFATIATSEDERIIVDPWMRRVYSIPANCVDNYVEYQSELKMDGTDLFDVLKNKYSKAIKAIDNHIDNVNMSLEKSEMSPKKLQEFMLQHPDFRIYD